MGWRADGERVGEGRRERGGAGERGSDEGKHGGWEEAMNVGCRGEEGRGEGGRGDGGRG